ncbi:MAG: single-stranded DNA-binding protein [Firmicutes bacterium]|nr:single-stranded DNA-binding protein [Bacillota bacterium]MBQ4409897.1 single-stranded DNA-binding protein [Bacillota bacterium]MBQ6295878.1 single-stranded DNA-binding protein [Bacillota bacterium]
MNSVCLVGRLTRDPEVRYGSQSQMAIARFSIAVDRPFADRNGERQTDFIRIVCFGKSAEFVEKYFKKGMRVGVTGSLRTDSYTNKDGVNVTTVEVAADRVEFMESRAERESREAAGNFGGNFGGGYSQPAPSQAPAGQAPEGFTALTDDDIPF